MVAVFEVPSGVIDSLKGEAVDYMKLDGEKDLPHGIIVKSNEPGALGIGVDRLGEFNDNVISVSFRSPLRK